MPTLRRTFVLADGREIEREMGTVHVRIDGREHPTPCIFGEDGTEALLGVVTLEELGLGVDSINQTLVPVKGRLKAALRRRFVPASDPDADPHCRLTREDGQRRQTDTDALFSHLTEQREAEGKNQFVFTGDRDDLWERVSSFVDEEALCCPFFSFEQVEDENGVRLFVGRGQ